ncbi:gliding motility-associated C-terminal domain-containing protein [Flavobacterium sp.]|uniref:HYR-like domain-containing protein n=1 Tax=Flavobacterium sp. TaxID=239 RepID=UPI0039E3D489
MKNLYFTPKNTLKFIVAMAFLVGGLFSAEAQVRKNFTQRTSSYTPTKKIYNIKGNFTMLGNTCLTPQNYGDNTNNNGQYMTYVDTDGDPNTFNSSASTLVLSTENGAVPACSNIIYAGLYWTGKSSANTTFNVTKSVPNGTAPVNTNSTVGHNQNIANTNYSLSISRNNPSNTNRNPIYTFSGNGNTYVFNFYNSGAAQRVTLSVNGGGAVNVPVTVNGAGTVATLNTPYQITDGNVVLTIKALNRNAATNLSTGDTQSSSTADVNVTGTIPVFSNLTKTYDKRVISLKGPASASYTQFTAATADIYYPSGTDDDIYTAYTEITDYVRTNGIGQYWAADMALLKGNVGGTGYAGGWGIIVVYENSKMKYRDVTIFDGYAYVNSGNSSALDLPVAGFNSVQVGNVGMTLGIMASEGDVAFTGDFFRVRKLNTANYQTLDHGGSTATNFFNSAINAPGARNPQLQNNTAIDIIMTDVPNPGNSVIGNNQTSTNFQYGTDGDTYSIFAIAMAVDAYIPDTEGNISAVTINGQPAGPGPYTALPGQDLEYKIQIRNRGTEAINNFKITVPVPYNTTYVAGSASRNVYQLPLPTPNNLTFEPTIGANGSLVWDYGTLPLPIGGNPETLLADMTFKFKVTTDCTLLKNTNCNNVVSVNGSMTGTGATTGITLGNKSLIQGYTVSGSCTGVEIAAPLQVSVNAQDFVNQNCQSVPPITAFFICNSGTTIPITEVTGAFPPGSTFWSAYPVVSGQTVQYTINNPFPSTLGTSTYYAIPPGVLNGCFFQFTITVTTVTSQPTAANVSYCQNAAASPLTATPSVPGYTLYYYTSENGSAQTSITPSTANVGSTTYWVAEAQSSTCIGPKKQIIVTVYPAPTITGPAPQTVQGCNPSAIPGNLPYATVATPITLAQLQAAGGNIPNAAAIGTYTLTYIDVASGTNPIVITRTFSVTNICGTAVVASQQITIQDTAGPVIPTLANVTGQCSATAVAPTATDACAGTITATTTDPLTYNTQGTFVITWSFNDGNGNITTATQNVIVDDTAAPVVPTLADVTGQCSATATPPTTTDACAGTLTGTTTDPLTYNTQGTFVIHWTFNDGNGNTINVNQNVIVDDTTAPIVPTLADVTGQCSATATPPTTTDACAGTLIGTTTDPLTYTTQGTHVIHWTFTDGNGQSINVNQNVIIDDTTAPVIPTLADITAQCSATVVPPTTTDNCAGTLTATTTDPLTYNTQGTFVIHWTFNDGNGQSINVNQNVIINNNVPPSVPVLADVVGQCSATATPPTSTNSCTGVTIVATTNDPLTYTQQGTYVIHWSFNDGNGNIVTANQNVIVDDTTAPVVPNLANVTGQCSATATPPTTTDNCAGTLTGTTTDPLTYNTQGTFVITWTFNDGNGNTSTATQTVIVDDTTAPVVPQLANVTGQCSATVTPPTTTDNCAGTLTATTSDPLTYNTQGTFVVTWTFNDGNGNTSTATQTVIVDDTTAPVVPTLANVTGECSATAVPPTTTDNCAGTITATTNDPLTYTTQGTFTITWTFNDGNGNTSTATQTVIVDDVTAPVVPTLADITAQCSATAVPPTTTDNCAGTLTATTADPLTYNTQGTFVIHWTFNDGNGNSINVNQNVIIDNTTAPVIPTLADVVGQCSATATPPTSTNSCTGATIVATTNDPLTYTTQGTFVITWTFDDGNGNVVTATQNVIVDDTTAPVIPQLANVTGECSATATPPTTTDNCAGTITATTNDPLTYNTQGTFTITWTFNDGNGNIVTAEQNVIVDDVTAPVVPQLATVTGQCSATVTPPSTTDGCIPTPIVGTTNDPLTYTEQGTYTVTWTFNDGNGNTSTATQTVIVDDTVAPVIPTLADITAECTATATPPTTTDNCAGTLTATTNDPLTYNTQGTHVIVWTFNDGNGNSINVNQNVIIDDVTAPVVPTLADVTGQCNACATPPTTTDNCGGTITGTTTNELCYDQQGTFVIVWTFNDGNGNISTANQNVIIDNTVPPVIPTLADVTGECSACAVAPTTTNSCTGQVITATTNDPLCYTVQGSYVITWSFDDGNGNIVTATQNVIVDDVTAPVLPVLADVTGECSATATPPSTTDNCIQTPIVGTTNDPLTYTEQGSYVITWTFDDGNGNITTATQNVIVDDVTAPVLPTLADVTGECSACAVAPTTQDNCGGVITATTTDELCYTTQGTHVITWTFDDGNGNITTATQNVIVDDVTAPVLPVLADVTGECSATVTPPSTTDNCIQTPIVGTTNDPLTYTEQGSYVITWTFDDGNGNITTATQNVIVDDVTAPVVPTLADVTGQCNACATPPTTTDNCGGTITGTTTNELCYDQQGTFVIVWTFDDGNGNVITVNQNVIIDNTVPPTIPTLADVTGECSACAVAPTTTNSCTGQVITATTNDPLCYTEQGSYVITWSFDDGNGNIVTATQNVIVDDVTAPAIPTLADVTGECSACAVAPTTQDNCGGVITATTTDELCYDVQGTHVITWTFDDGNGNITTATQNVIVDDVTAPSIPTLADVTGECSACAVAPVTQDNCGGVITGTTTDELCYTTQGTHVITWTFDDGNGNVTTATQNVIVNDVTAPVAPVLADVTGQCNACATPPTTTDNCGGTITGTTTDALCYDQQGTFVITWTFDDGNGNVTTATQNVVIDNTTPPVIPVLADVTGECSACAVAPVFTNICTGATITATTTDPICYDQQGTYVITWTFDDGNGNVVTAPQNVIVDDVTAPVIPTLADVTGECSACAVAPVATDNCGGQITATTNDPLCYTEQGSYVITWSFDDGNGNVVTATQNVIVDDVTAPIIPLLANITGECSATVPVPSTTDNCNQNEIVGTTNDPLNYTEQGTYVVTWTFDDGNGNVVTATQNVIVDDVTAPVVPTLANVTGECSACAVAPTTTDNCGGTITATTTDPLCYTVQGTYVITWTFDDGNGNVSTATQTVIVDDVTAPVIPALADLTGECSVTATPPSIADNCAGSITATTVDPLFYDIQGTYVIHWEFNDGNGNITMVNQNVIVDDVTAPVVPTLANVTGECSATAVPPTTTDNCAGTLTATTSDPLVYTTQGTFIITWTFNDGNGNTSTATQTVIVDDVTAPVVPVLADVNGSCSVTLTAPTTTDNCNPNVITGTTPQTTFGPGTYVVTWTFDDGNGNISTANQNVVVLDGNQALNETGYLKCFNDISLSIDLSTKLGTLPAGGTWTDLSNTGHFDPTTGIFDPNGEMQAGHYNFQYVVNDGACTLTLNVDVEIDDDCIVEPIESCEPIVHNAFSPNGDGTNEWFQIDNFGDLECVPTNTVEIYNRWGILIFETNQYDNNTRVFRGQSEGRANVGGDDLPTGTYFYIIHYKYNNSNTEVPNYVDGHKEGYLYLSK